MRFGVRRSSNVVLYVLFVDCEGKNEWDMYWGRAEDPAERGRQIHRHVRRESGIIANIILRVS